MWLIHTSTLTLEEFAGSDVPTYAILSHTWQDDEVSLLELENGAGARSKAGFAKIEKTCELAQRRGIEYAWIDTCCINKDSSAELSESINSMFQWYKQSAVCFVYLADVHSPNVVTGSGKEFRNSRWFTRGWTLQELIAPAQIEFFNSEWCDLGSRMSLNYLIGSACRIPISVLDGSQDLTSYSIAQRMSWAAGRSTTRVEDTAYCLLGIFDIGMPLLYGEGKRAFRRLQEEIIKESADHSIFAWKLTEERGYHGLFAQSPDQFVECENVLYESESSEYSAQRHWMNIFRQPYQQTNMGLQIKLPSKRLELEVFHVALNCFDYTEARKKIGIFLACPADSPPEMFGRVQYAGRDRLPYELSAKESLRDLHSLQIPRSPFPRFSLFHPTSSIKIVDFTVRKPQNLSMNLLRRPERALSLEDGIKVLARPLSWKAAERTVLFLPGLAGCAVAFAIPRSTSLSVVAKLWVTKKDTLNLWISSNASPQTASVKPVWENAEPSSILVTEGLVNDLHQEKSPTTVTDALNAPANARPRSSTISGQIFTSEPGGGIDVNSPFVIVNIKPVPIDNVTQQSWTLQVIIRDSQ